MSLQFVYLLILPFLLSLQIRWPILFTLFADRLYIPALFLGIDTINLPAMP